MAESFPFDRTDLWSRDGVCELVITDMFQTVDTW